MGEEEVLINLIKLTILSKTDNEGYISVEDNIMLCIDFYKMGYSEGMKSVVNDVNG